MGLVQMMTSEIMGCVKPVSDQLLALSSTPQNNKKISLLKEELRTPVHVMFPSPCCFYLSRESFLLKKTPKQQQQKKQNTPQNKQTKNQPNQISIEIQQ